MDKKEKVYFSDYQEILSVLDSPEDLNYDLHLEQGREEYEDVFRDNKIRPAGIKEDIKNYFRNGDNLNFAFYISRVGHNGSTLYLKTKVYYFRHRQSMLDFIRKMEPETYDSMDRKNLANNTFIHFNNIQ